MKTIKILSDLTLNEKEFISGGHASFIEYDFDFETGQPIIHDPWGKILIPVIYR